MKSRLIASLVFAVLATVGYLFQQAEAQPGTVKEVVKGVWFREGERQFGHCNNIIIEMKDYLIVMDANFPSGARATLEAARRISNKPVRYVFDTHHHGDHAYGNAVWTKLGAVTIAHINVSREMDRLEPERWRQAARQRKDVAELGLDGPERPKQTFEKSPYEIRDETRLVQFWHFGWAHTRGDGFVYLPQEKVLCTGDAVVNGPYNFTGDAHLSNWPSVIAQAQKLDVQYVLPGHGPMAGPELMEGQKQFFIELRKAVQAAMDSGKKLEDIVSFRNGQPVSTTIELPESVKNWVGDRLAVQVRDMYEELKQGKPRGLLNLP